jgi:hypothetical protein
MPNNLHTNRINLIYGIVLTASLLIASIMIFWPKTAVSEQVFVECLKKNNVVMYGTDTCGACITQKEIFGVDFKGIDYVNCAFNNESCIFNKIAKFPTWKKDEQILTGVQTLESLSRFSGCEL